MADAPLLIALPDGLNVSGVTSWAVRLANEFARRGRRCGLIVRAEPVGMAHVGERLDRRTMVFEAPPFPAPGGDLEAHIDLYARAARVIGRGDPVVLSPNLRGDAYGVGVGAARRANIRLVGWQHADNEYDGHVLAHFAPAIERFVGVSEHIARTLRAKLGARAGDCVRIPYGVSVPADPPAREPLENRPLRLVYTGRMEHRQKRILALVHLADELTRMGVAYELTLIGDGLAACEIDALAQSRPSMRRREATDARAIASILDASDLFVLASRYEGLSVSMLEAMARGCVPVVTRVASGAGEAIEHGVNGVLVDVAPDAGESVAGEALARGAGEALRADLPLMSRAAWATVKDRYSLRTHVDRVVGLIDSAASAAPRSWREDRPLAFDGAAGTVGPDGRARLARLLESLAGRCIIVHGAGAHTRALWDVFARAPVTIVAIADDDRALHGSVHGVPVVSPREAAEAGATDVVISSWMHGCSIWSRRQVYEVMGLRVHRIYQAPLPQSLQEAPCATHGA